MLRILSQVGVLQNIAIPEEIASRIEIIAIPSEGELEPGLTGDVLLTRPSLVPNLAHVLTRGPRWVHLIGTGIDDFPIGVIGDQCVLTNSRGLSAMPIAEWVMACMLSFVKRMPGSFVTEPPKHWNIPSPGFGALHGAKLAMLGLGGIGTALAHRALAFDMEVVALRQSDAPSPIEGVRLVRRIDELVADADHLALVAPLTDATRGLLRRALDADIVACADLDSTDPEPLPAGHWFYEHPRVRVSPHSSWNWPGAFPAMFDMFLENLRRYLDDEPLLSVVDPADGY